MSIPLAQLPNNTPARITVIHASGEILARMFSWGITLHSSINILRRGPFHGPLQVQLGRHISLMLPAVLAASIEVTAL